MKMEGQVRLRAFTLIEIFVTIAIIGVLASMILGVVDRSIKKAQGVHCAGNLRTIYGAFQAYVADNQGFIPCALGPQTEVYSQYNYNQYWWDSAYLGGYLSSDPPARSKKLSEKEGKILNCPARPVAHDEYWKARHSTPPVSYVMTSGIPYKYLAINNPSKTLFLTEGRQSVVWPSVAASLSEDWIDDRLDTRKRLRRFHGKALNLLFFDGHVETFSGPDSEIVTYFAD